jgi:hypothetical protein
MFMPGQGVEKEAVLTNWKIPRQQSRAIKEFAYLYHWSSVSPPPQRWHLQEGGLSGSALSLLAPARYNNDLAGPIANGCMEIQVIVRQQRATCQPIIS